MPLALDATVGGAAANSYATVEDADEALDYRVGAAAWSGLAADDKIRALVTATRDLDTLEFIGVRATSTQALEWPRTGTPYPADVVPAAIVMATVERALELAPALAPGTIGDPLAPVPSNVKEDTVGPITTVYFEPVVAPQVGLDRLTGHVRRLLESLVRSPAAATWGTGSAVRTS